MLGSLAGHFALFAAGVVQPSMGERVWIEQEPSGRFQVLNDGSPLGVDGTVRGAGGTGYMDVAQLAGADALRTWGVEELGEKLAEAAERGLRISAGIWMPHSPSVYANCSSTDMSHDVFWQSELDRYIAAVHEYKNSSGLLWWTVGNEEELEIDVFRGNECVWKRLEWAVAAVKAADPDHPVGTVTAGAMEPKVRFIEEYVPSLDFLGVNSYGDSAVHLGDALREWNWTKPYAIMEFGPSGHWAANRTEWGAYIEETSSEKVPRYNATCYKCYDDPQCIGAFAFVWGWKWEKTGTWYNMFNEWQDVTTGVAVNCTSCESEVVEAMQTCWTGSHRAVRPPTLLGVYVDGEELVNMSFIVPRSDDIELRVDAVHPLGSALVGIWALTEEIVSNAVGGAFEATNPLLTGVWQTLDTDATTVAGLRVKMNSSSLKVGGEYRLYVFVRQDPDSCGDACENQEAYASLPFRVCHHPVEGEVCHRQVLHAMEGGIAERPELYPGLTLNSTFDEVQMFFHQTGTCPPPCHVRVWCGTSPVGSLCYEQVQWLMERVSQYPDAYPTWLRTATFEGVQNYLQEQGDGTCPKACELKLGGADAESTTQRVDPAKRWETSSAAPAAAGLATLAAFAAIGASTIVA